jgi:hypothetical protein
LVYKYEQSTKPNKLIQKNKRNPSQILHIAQTILQRYSLVNTKTKEDIIEEQGIQREHRMLAIQINNKLNIGCETKLTN